MISLEFIRECLQGGIPSTVATCSPDGVPNATYITQAHYVDPEHIALSQQFFSKTHQNVLVNSYAEIGVIHPGTGVRFHIEVQYVRTETSGPLFETMKARLAGIASHVGMSKIFKLKGADIYRVLNISRVSRDECRVRPPRLNYLSATRAVVEAVVQANDLGALFDEALAKIETHLGVRHAMILMNDAGGERLYTVASRGYAQSGVGSEIAVGCGVIGVAAEYRTPILISYASQEYSYGNAIRESAAKAGLSIEAAIPLPGLPDSQSQLAVPLLAGHALLGVLYVESPTGLCFDQQDEDALAAISGAIAGSIRALQESAEAADHHGTVPRGAPQDSLATDLKKSGNAVRIRHYPFDHSVFIDNEYLIKGVAGAIFVKLAEEFIATGRDHFSNHELRLDTAIKLPDFADSLEARLILLQRRLAERSAAVQIERTGRGRFCLKVTRPLEIVTVPARPAR